MLLQKLTSVLSLLGSRMRRCAPVASNAHKIAKVKSTANEDDTFQRLKYGKCYKVHCSNTGIELKPCRLLSSVSAGKIQFPCNCCSSCRAKCGQGTESSGPR